MTVPIYYVPKFIEHPTEVFNVLWEDLNWIRHDKVPRREYYCNDYGVAYTYGTPPYDRTYQAQPWHPEINNIGFALEKQCGVRFDMCFLNGYEDSKDQLGWHADDSPEMDDSRPIAIVSLGAEREIWFQDNNKLVEMTKLKLENGSLCLMAPGMQDTHRHRIPRSDIECGPRISLTFRGYVK